MPQAHPRALKMVLQRFINQVSLFDQYWQLIELYSVYKLAKFLVPLIESFTSNEYTVRNSYDFYDSVIALDESITTGFMVSYDISSLVLGKKRTGKKRTGNKHTGKKRTGKKRIRKRAHAEKSSREIKRSRKKAQIQLF